MEDRVEKSKGVQLASFHDEPDIVSVNNPNEHFNRKIERDFRNYAVKIKKNNLERGTPLPD
uniref:Pre-mRNA-splicing factor SYF2 n=1 Tax=Physcomitrium patens TaxID=3218 RepID=A0A7I4FDR6_PHYPA